MKGTVRKVKASNYAGIPEKYAKRIRSRCVERPASGCLEWAGAKTSKGYGNIAICVDGKKRYLPPHRVLYVLERGPIDPTLEIDHLCRNRLCCNLDHMEPVTTQENTRRGTSFAVTNAAKTHCKYGHEFTEENTWKSPSTGRRKCRTCQKDRRAKRYREVERPNLSKPRRLP